MLQPIILQGMLHFTNSLLEIWICLGGQITWDPSLRKHHEFYWHCPHLLGVGWGGEKAVENQNGLRQQSACFSDFFRGRLVSEPGKLSSHQGRLETSKLFIYNMHILLILLQIKFTHWFTCKNTIVCTILWVDAEHEIGQRMFTLINNDSSRQKYSFFIALV